MKFSKKLRFRYNLAIFKSKKWGIVLKISKFSRVGFILATAGSAVGLGNIWKFPYITGENGGGVFVFIYLLTLGVVGFSLLIAEMLIGYIGKSDSVTSFERLAPKHKSRWKYGGFIAFTGVLILTFYLVVIGWIFRYIFDSFSLPLTLADSEAKFTNFLTGDIASQILFFTISAFTVFYIVSKGIKSGIEKLNLYLMPTLIVILLLIFGYSSTLDAFSKSIDFMFNLNFDTFKEEAIILAIGHSFFTLSLGMAVIMTYSASLKSHSNLFKNALFIVFIDTAIALIAGVAIFTFIFENNSEVSKGVGLVFISLPSIFANFGELGNILSFAFFLILAFAGLTSAISILEPSIQYLMDRFKFKRVKSIAIAGSFVYIFGLLALLSNTLEFGESLTFFGKTLFDIFDFISSSILLPVGGVIIAIFIGYVVQRERVNSYLKHSMSEQSFKIWYFSIRYIAPISVSLVILNELGIF